MVPIVLPVSKAFCAALMPELVKYIIQTFLPPILANLYTVFWKFTLNMEVESRLWYQLPLYVCDLYITKACLYNFDPLKPHFYIVKLGFTGTYIIFLISSYKHRWRWRQFA